MIDMQQARTAIQQTRYYNVVEEVFNSLTHGFGAVLGAFGLVLMLLSALQHDSRTYVVSAVVYGLSIVFLFLASTLYHAIPNPGAKRVFKVIDHSAIYLLIAGTYTPFLLVTFSGTFGVVMMVIIWSLAVAGVIFKVFFTNRFHNISLITYLGMGWLSLVAAYELVQNLPLTALWLLLGRRRRLLPRHDLLPVEAHPVQPRHLAPLRARRLFLPFPGRLLLCTGAGGVTKPPISNL